MKKIKLTQRKWALVDDDMHAELAQYKWCASKESRGTKFYAIRWKVIDGKSTKIRMHRVVVGLPPGAGDHRVVDHLNNNSLDNRRANLEIITQEENMKRSPGWRKKAVLSKDTDDDFLEDEGPSL